jgi:DNA-binding transcriptional LysR family regulator
VQWDDLRFFLAVARQGSLSAAARTLRVAQPTVGRRITAFERRLGARLFVRAPSGRVLSPTGRTLLAHAVRMEHEALAAETAAAGRDEGLSGRVRITASEWMVRSVLGPALTPFLGRHAGLCLDLVADTRPLNLGRREADLAVRPARFAHQEVFQRALAVVAFGLYASEPYLARHGVPDFARRSAGHALLAMSEDMRTIVDVKWLPPLVGQARIAAFVNGREPMATMAAAGLGLACLPRILGDATPGLRLLPTPGARPERTLWLGAHRDARSIDRVRATITFLVAAFDELRPALSPAG